MSPSSTWITRDSRTKCTEREERSLPTLLSTTNSKFLYNCRIHRTTFNGDSFSSGDPIPRIDYTESEVSTWTAVFKTVKDLMPKHACMEYRKVFSMMEEEGIFEANKIPQLEDVSAFLKSEYSGLACPSFPFSPYLWLFNGNCRTHRIYAQTGRGIAHGPRFPRQSGVPRIPEHAVRPSHFVAVSHPGAVSISQES